MLDNASELIEENIECSILLDEERIKKKVFQNIRKSNNKHIVWRKRRYAAIFIAVLGISGITVWAHTVIKGAGEIRENRDEIMKEQQSQKIDESSVKEMPEQHFEILPELISPENLYEEGIPIAKYIVELKVDSIGKISECYLDNGAMIIFTPSDGNGWSINVNEKLKFKFQQERIDNLKKAGTLEVGYIYEGEIFMKDTLKQKESEIELDFSEPGKYALYLKNLSSDRIIISNGTLNKIQEEK